MSLKTILRKHQYDLIEGPIRNQEILQVWRKIDLNKIEFYASSLSKLFKSDFLSDAIINDALKVTSTEQETYEFSAGIGMVKNALLQFNLADAKIEDHIKGGKSITIAYNNSYTKEFDLFDLTEYLSSIVVDSKNKAFLHDLNKDHLIVISGIVYAKNLQIVMESDSAIDSGVEGALNKVAEGKVSFKRTGNNQITLAADSVKEFPIAVKAYRIRFKKSTFNKLIPTSDNRNFF